MLFGIILCFSESSKKRIDTFVQRAAPSSSKSSQETIEATATSDEEMTTLLTQLQDARNQRAREQKKVSELSQQLTTLLQENGALEEQLTEWRNKAQDVKSLQDEISTLEEVRYVRSHSFPFLERRSLHISN